MAATVRIPARILSNNMIEFWKSAAGSQVNTVFSVWLTNGQSHKQLKPVVIITPLGAGLTLRTRKINIRFDLPKFFVIDTAHTFRTGKMFHNILTDPKKLITLFWTFCTEILSKYRKNKDVT